MTTFNLKEYQKKYYKKHKRKYIETRLKRTFGISCDEYEKIFQEQDGKCQICKTSLNLWKEGFKERACLDHDHLTGKLRGFLCANCNHALGKFKDNISFLENAIHYLTFYKTKHADSN